MDKGDVSSWVKGSLRAGTSKKEEPVVLRSKNGERTGDVEYRWRSVETGQGPIIWVLKFSLDFCTNIDVKPVLTVT